MVSDGVTDYGEEYVWKWTFRQDQISRDAEVEVLLYDDSTDNLDDASDIDDITTEPDDGNYSRQTFDLDSSDVELTQVDGNLRAEADVTFDVTDTTGDVDASAAIVNFESDVVGDDSEPTDHLLTTGLLLDSDENETTADLSQFSSLEATVEVDLD